MKKIVLLGDSLRLMGYGTKLQEIMGDEYEVWQTDDNGRFAAYTFRLLSNYEKHVKEADIIHWNNGVWDTMRLYGDGTFTTLEDYKKTVLRMAKVMIEYYGKKVIFATTTPVDERYPYAKNEDIEKFNAAVVPELKEMGVIINDLHAFVSPHKEEYIKEGDYIHLSEKGIDACAKEVARIIKENI